ncbi:MAG: T9SS C-terminal target domain-containing protein [Haliscomenobacteraceae bacterium CHB4]|nr:hypothetical protein [Saprospiraceae bacterium]MCE7924787.1 T9SS C-terminal target domain-containing protein [Haliscomenobacteraceae bacterium CHB4]
MKNLFPFLLAACCCTPLFSQNTTTWFVPGCQWRYQYESILGFGEEVFQDAGTEVIGGEICTKLHRTAYHVQFSVGWYQDHGYYYLFARNDSVFWWQNGFQLLYDFTLLPGDTFYLPPYLPPGFAVIDSVGTTNWQGIPLRFQDWRMFYDNIPPDIPPYSTRVYERVGAEYLIYPSAGMGYPLSEIQYNLTCYRDDEYPLPDCDLTYDPGYVEFPASPAVWSEENDSWWCYYWGFQYVQIGDTIVPGYSNSKKLYYRPTYQGNHACPTPSATIFHEPLELIGALSQNIAEKKVYFTLYKYTNDIFPVNLDFASLPGIGETKLLYDFDLEPGESVAWKPQPNLFVGNDSIQLDDGTWRRRYFFANELGEIDSSYYWLEGIGGGHSLFTSYINPAVTDVGSVLNCFRENNVLKYSRVDAAFCDSVVVATTEPLLNAQVQLYPNPTSGSVTLEIQAEALPALLQLFDAQGKLLHRQEIMASSTSLDVSRWSSNVMLFARIQSADGRQAGKKLTVE